MHDSFLKLAEKLNHGQEAYATAFVVRRTVPSSGKPGDKAIITPDGKITGWIGGGCTRGIVLKEALLSLQEGKPRFVSISPEATNADPSPNTKLYKMTCQSGGAVDVYIEPVLPKPGLVIFGHSHIGMAIAKIAKAMDYHVTAVIPEVDKNLFPAVDQLASLASLDPEQILDHSYLIVCTQGENDLDALKQALSLDMPYVSFVSSRIKAHALFSDLRKDGVSFDQLKKIKTPAGLDIGAKLPEEVAVSILAEIISHFRQQREAEQLDTQQILQDSEEYYLNPVCQIPIKKSTAKYVLEHGGEKVYFCCDGCKIKFEEAPDRYI